MIGGGASGLLSVAHLARAAAQARVGLDVVVVDDAPLGQGVAYSTRDPRHRLNVAARGMTAWPDDPGHFLRWLRRHVDRDYCELGFAQRRHYARYLASVLDEATAGNGHVRVEHARCRATDLRPTGDGWEINLADGRSLAADEVVLAFGYGDARVDWAPPALYASPRLHADPWHGDPCAVSGDGDVVIVGAGLTAIDTAMTWADAGRRIHFVSRNGMLPLGHAVDPAPMLSPPDLPASPVTAAALRRLLFARVRETGGDWRRAVDSLRPITAELWRRMPADEQRAFAATSARRWDRVRHRIDPEVADWLAGRQRAGRLVSHTGEVTAAEERANAIRLTLTSGASIDAVAVLNCTGASSSISRSTDPLVRNLLARGVVQPGPLDLGVATDPAGRTRTGAGGGGLWAVGPLRRGELWESVAIPEIRVQACTVAGAIVAGHAGARARGRSTVPAET